MICCIVIKPVGKCQGLIINRHNQNLLTSHLEDHLSYKPFVFNSSKGMYIFVKKKEPFAKIENILSEFCEVLQIEDLKLHDTTLRPYFFRRETHEMLTSKELSALGWKRFISSFLMQIDPYDAKTSAHSIGVFKRFKSNIKKNGTKLQKKFFKKRMKMLRDRVSLKSIDHLLHLD